MIDFLYNLVQCIIIVCQFDLYIYIWFYIHSQNTGLVFLCQKSLIETSVLAHLFLTFLSLSSCAHVRHLCILIHAIFVSFCSTSTRPVRTATRWFWVKGRTVWSMLGGTWATKCASPSKRSPRRTARTRNINCLPRWETLSRSVSHMNLFFHNTLNGKGFGSRHAHWLDLERQCSLGIFGEIDEC